MRKVKKAVVLVVCFLLTVFTGCSRSKKAIWESGVHYEVSNVGSVEKKEFQYWVYDQQHNTIDSGCTDDIEPIFYENDGFLRLSLNYGSGAAEYKYYDVSKGLVSERYNTVLSDRFTQDGVLIAYLSQEDNTVAVAVQDAFDKSVFYKTLTAEFPMKFSPSTQAEFISDTQLRITYLTGEDNDEKIELFTIR